MSDSNFWRGKVVLITGASSGIGESFALHVAARGAKTGLLARNEERLRALKARLGGAAAYAVADVADLDAMRAGVGQLETALGPCDVLVASAGIHRIANGREFDASAALRANELIATNVCGVINAFSAVLPGMVERRRGHLCAVASIAGLLGLPTAAVYSASKAAVLTLCEGLRIDLRPVGVKVTAVGPGFTDTPMAHQLGEPPERVWLMPAEEAARRIAWAIERGRAEYFFPTGVWLKAWIASKLPASLYGAMWRWLMRKKRELKERGEW